MQHDDETREIRIGGDWSIFGIAQKMPLLLDQLKNMASSVRPVVDLAEVEEIDVTGWQLLALWLRHCRLLGVEPLIVNLRADLRARLDRLGFTADFRFAESEPAA